LAALFFGFLLSPPTVITVWPERIERRAWGKPLVIEGCDLTSVRFERGMRTETLVLEDQERRLLVIDNPKQQSPELLKEIGRLTRMSHPTVNPAARDILGL
jgi:hypothetical protein